jgi:hypothetical protein
VFLIFKREASAVAPISRSWFRLSLVLAVVASAAGTILGIVFIFAPIGVPSLLTCIQSVHLFCRFEKGIQPAAHWAGAAVAVVGLALSLMWFAALLHLRP